MQPILTIKVNTREAGSVDRIVGEEGNMMKQGDTSVSYTHLMLLMGVVAIAAYLFYQHSLYRCPKSFQTFSYVLSRGTVYYNFFVSGIITLF